VAGSPVDAGTYTAIVTIPDTNKVTGGIFVFTNSVNISQGTATCTLDSAISTPYDGAAHTNTFTVTPGMAWTVTYTTNGIPDGFVSAPVEIGGYDATVEVVGDANATGGTFVFSNAVVVTKALATCSIDSRITANYDGLAHTNTFTVAPTGLSWSVTYSPAHPPKNVGIYSATVRVTGDAHYDGITNTFAGAVTILDTSTVSRAVGASYVIDFETYTPPSSYVPVNRTLSATNPAVWYLNNAITSSTTNDVTNGLKSIRLRYVNDISTNGVMQSLTPFSNGIHSVAFNYALYGTSTKCELSLETSANGVDWTSHTNLLVTNKLTFLAYSNTLALGPATYLRFQVTSNSNNSSMMNLDDIVVLPYNPLAATVTVSNVSQMYDGNAKTVTVATVPAFLNVAVTYNGSATPPIATGDYAVVATIASPGYTGSSNTTLTIIPGLAPPQFNALGAQTAYVDSLLTFKVSATGYPDPVLALTNSTATGGSYTCTTNGTELTVNYTPPVGDLGSKIFYFRATNTEGVATTTVTVAVSDTPPAAPTNIWASVTNFTDFTAAWTPVSGATSYLLDVSTNSNFQSGSAGTTTILSNGFESGLLTGWTQSPADRWMASPTNPLNGTYSLQQVYNDTVANSNQISYALSGLNLTAADTTWRMQVKHANLPSAGNYWSVFLSADQDAAQMTRKGTVNGYIVGVNYGGLSDDILRLWEVTAGAATEVINSGLNWQTTVSNTYAGGIEVIRTAAGEWSLKVDTNGNFDALTSYGTPATETTHTTASYFGVLYVYTSTGDLKLWVDDVSITQPSGGTPDYVPGYSNRTVSGTSQIVTNLTTNSTYYFRVWTVAGTGTSTNSSPTANVTTRESMPAFTSGTGTFYVPVGVATAITVSASGDAPVLALQGTTATNGYSFPAATNTGVLTYTPPEEESGERTFTFTASNAVGVATQTVYVWVGGSAPEFATNAIALSATAGVAMATYTVNTSTGAPTPALVLKSTTASNGYYWFTNATGTLDYTPPQADAGPRTFTFTASNGLGVATQTVTVTVYAAPVFNALAAQSATTDVAMAFTVGASGYPTPITLALTNSTATSGYSFNPASGVLTYTAPYADVGTQTFYFTASNSQGVATTNVSVTVTEGLPPPPSPIWASATNTADFTAAWTAVANASDNYRLDVSTNAMFLGNVAAPVSTLTAGDIAIIGANFDADRFTFLALANLDVGTAIYFTENGWTNDHFRTGEGIVLWSNSTANPIMAGTMVSITPSATASTGTVSGTSFALSASGDQILAYQKTASSTTMIYAVNSQDIGWQASATNTESSGLPTGLTDGTTAIALNEVDNFVYGMSVTAGTKAELLAAIGNTNNWTVSNTVTNALPPAGSFTVTGVSGDPSYVPGYSNLTVSGTSHSVTGLTPNTLYYFRMRSASALGTGTYSSVASVTTVDLAPFFTSGTSYSTTNGVELTFTESATGDPVPTLALQSTTATGGSYGWTNGTSPSMLTYTPPLADAGTRTFTFTASNSLGVVTQVVSVAVHAPPVFNALGTQYATSGVPMSFTVSVQGLPPTFAVVEADTGATPGSYTLNPATGLLTYTPPYADVGDVSFTFTASNSLGMDTQVVSVVVAEGLPAAPAPIWASAMNAADFTAAWGAPGGATSYRLDVGANSNFTAGSANTNLIAFDFADYAGDEAQGISTFAATHMQAPAYITRGTGLTASANAGRFNAGGWSTNFADAAAALAAGEYFEWTIQPGADHVTMSITNILLNIQRSATGASNLALRASHDGYATNLVSTNGMATNTAALALSCDLNGVPAFQNVSGAITFRLAGWGGASGGALGFEGAGDDILIQGSLATPAYIPGYSNLTVAGTSQSVTGLAAGATYYFRARAVSAIGTGTYSSVASVATKGVQAIHFAPIDNQTATNLVKLTAIASSGLPVSFAVASGPGSIASGTNLTFSTSGTVSIVASQAGNTSWDPAPDVTNTFNVTKAKATVTLGNLAQMWDGNAKTVTVTTVPADLSVDVTYDGSATAPSNAGSYAVTGIVNDLLYQGSTNGTLVISNAPVFNALGTQYATSGVATAFTVSATGWPTPALALESQTATSGYDFVPATGVLTYTPPLADGGTTKTFTFTASNELGVATQTVSVVVTAASAPAFTGGAGPYATTTGVALVFTETASGAPAPTLALQSTTAPSGYVFTAGTGELSYTPPLSEGGKTNTFTFTASNLAGVATQTVEVAVTLGPSSLAAWDFTGAGSPYPATWTAEVYNASMDGSSNITRGAGAPASTGTNSFRTTGFGNEGIALDSNDYYQVTLSSAPGHKLSLTSITGRFAGTPSFYTNVINYTGVRDQWAYSLDGTNFTWIGSPLESTSLTRAWDFSGVSALQNLTEGATVTLRYFASGQTGTGAWGFYSRADNSYGLDIFGIVDVDSTTPGILVSGDALAFGSVVTNVASAEQSYTVSGVNLGANIVITPPPGFEISLTSGSGFSSSAISLTPSSGTVAETTIFVRFKPATAGVYNSVLTHTSAGATQKDKVVTGTGTYSADSDIIRDSGFTEFSSIAYGSYQETNLTSSSLQVGSFTIRDGGGAADSDALGTTLTAITFTVANGDNLRRVALYDGTTEIAEGYGGTTVVFTNLAGLSAADGATKTFKVLASFASTVTDNAQLTFTVASATADSAGSIFAAADAGGAATDVTGDRNRIIVAATQLAFASLATVVPIAQNFSAVVQAQDANQNVDVDSIVSVTLGQASGSGTLSGGGAQSLVTGAYTWTALQYSEAGEFTIAANGGGLAGVTSVLITASAPLDGFIDGNFTGSPVWSGDTTNWIIVADSDAGAGATGSQTLRQNGPAGTATNQLRTQIAYWGVSQEWGLWVGRRNMEFATANRMYIWLYANEADLESSTVDGYRLAIGGDSTYGDKIRLERVTNGVADATILTSEESLVDGLTDVGFLIRVTHGRKSAGVWELYTSVLPTTNGEGSVATEVPANATVFQGTGVDSTLESNGYFGVVAVQTIDGAQATEIDQIYFQPYSTTRVVLYSFTAGEENDQVVVRWRTASEEDTVGFYVERWDGSAWVRVNKDILYAQGVDGFGTAYSLVDAGAVAGGTYTYRLVEVETSGDLQVYGPFERTAIALKLQSPVSLGTNGVWIRWLGRVDERYKILRSTNLIQGFQAIESGIPADPEGNEYLDTDIGGIGLYLIQVDEE
ncbi:MAG TPA: hypothetical protein DCM68_01815, partial [Verrucomicrobia bacterium]|nr:hypothetical protein [Verrucomicrobiota bacterium]